MYFTFQAGEDKSDKSEKVEFVDDENPERGNWSGKLDFLLSCLGYAVGKSMLNFFGYIDTLSFDQVLKPKTRYSAAYTDKLQNVSFSHAL